MKYNNTGKKNRGKPLLLFPRHNRWRAALRTQTVPNLDDPPSPALCLEYRGQHGAIPIYNKNHMKCTDPLMNSREFWKWRIWPFQASLCNPEPSKADNNEWWKSGQGKRFKNPSKNMLDGGWRGGEEGHKRWEEGALGQILLLHGKLSEYWVVYIPIKWGPFWERKWKFSSKSNHLQN